MDKVKRRLVLGWLSKAESDLLAARLLIEDEKRLLDIGVYHCQQAAEKAIKAWLTFQDIIFPKTHDLETLLHLSADSLPEASLYSRHARMLTPLATEFRYPGDRPEPEPERARQALSLASELYTHCHKLITAEISES